MKFHQIISFIVFKYAHWALVYLFFTKILETSIWGIFLFFYILDKMIRLIIVLSTFQPYCCGLILSVIVVGLQIEEVLHLFPHANNPLGIQALQTEIINIPMVPQIIYVMLWSFLSRDETAFLIQIPIMIIISFYINSIWSSFLRAYHYVFHEFTLLFIQFIAYFGLIYIALGINYFFLFFVPFQLILLMVVCYKFTCTIMFLHNNPLVNGLLFLYFGLTVFLHCGVDSRNASSGYELRSLQNMTQRMQNCFLVTKMLSLLFVLVAVMMSLGGYISINREGISDTVIIVVMIFAILSLVILTLQYIFFIVLPSLIGRWYIEIEGLEELKQQNELHRLKKDSLENIAYVTINPFESYLTREQKLSKEFMYALLFNFGNLPLDIHNVGKRIQQNKKLKVTFVQRFYLQDLQTFLQSESIVEDIVEIEFRYVFSQNPNALIYLVKLLYRPINPIIVKATDMPLLLLSYQQNNATFIDHTFLSLVFYEKHLSTIMTINPKQVLYDLYEY